VLVGHGAVRNGDQRACQYTVIGNKASRRPDVVIFVNGMPLGVVEAPRSVGTQAIVVPAPRRAYGV
jgi:type I site-specific restriction-modification system R (restriction) subunit